MSNQSPQNKLPQIHELTKRNYPIFLISVVCLFLEMLLIRWIGTEIRIFAYLQNTILVACFLGLGIGYFTSEQKIDIQPHLVSLVFLLLLMAIPMSRQAFGSISEFLSIFYDLVIWDEGVPSNNLWLDSIIVIIGLVLTYIVLIIIVDIFIPIGRITGRFIETHPNTIWAYSVNIAGSLFGTWIFVLVSFLSLPPVAWFAILCVLFLLFILWTRNSSKINMILLISILILSWFASQESEAQQVIWSPYQKLVVDKVSDEDRPGIYQVNVNNAGYQLLINLSEENILSNPEKFPKNIHGLSQYDIPLLLHPNPDNYLIVGAGAGNDAAGGIRNNVKHITAVDIDPAIITIGEELHPEGPYSNSNVKVVNDDARSFFATAKDKYDVITFGLLDSHTTTAMTNARLDHYVYTKESISHAKTLLNNGGIMVLTFEAKRPYIADRMGRLLLETFAAEPLVFRIPGNYYGWGGIMFVAGDLDNVRNQVLQNKRLGSYIDQLRQSFPISLSYTTKITTDDWPYIYLEDPEIPVLYFLLAILMVIIFIRTVIKWKVPRQIFQWHRKHWHFFFLGIAFLLLEVQNISKASVVLGNTWQTNAMIVSGVLIMLLIANLVAYKFPKIPIIPIYIMLILNSLALYFVDLAQFAFLPYLSKMIIIGSLTSLPMLFSGIIFIRSFAIVKGKDEALGSNIVGSIVGALLQSVTFIVGIKALLLIVASMYLLAMFTRPKTS